MAGCAFAYRGVKSKIDRGVFRSLGAPECRTAPNIWVKVERCNWTLVQWAGDRLASDRPMATHCTKRGLDEHHPNPALALA